jgi:hypothetical protein
MRNFGNALRNVYGVNEGFDIVLESVAIPLVLSYVHLQMKQTYVTVYSFHERHLSVSDQYEVLILLLRM